MNDIKTFTGEFFWLSNFYECPVVVRGIKFKSTEHAFQTFKTDDLQWRKDIRNAVNPGKAKRLGKKCPIRKNWDNEKVGVMKECLLAKFSQNEDLKQKLLATENVHLEEGNSWNDVWWGTCNGHGKNMLGRLLMEVREELRSGV